MSIVWLTEKNNNAKIAVNPEHVVAVFVASEGEMQGTTIVSLVNGTIPVAETDLEVVTLVNGASN